MREDLKIYYEHLEMAKIEDDFMGMLEALIVIVKHPLYKTDFIFQCLYILIKKGYYKEVNELLDCLIVLNRNQFEVNLLKNAIRNQERFEALEEEKKSIYYQAITEGHIFYNKGDLHTASDIYTWAYYETSQPIFKYYIGKMLFKNRNFKEAKKFFEDYLKNGDRKISKAYLYLSSIEKKRNQFSLVKKYQDYVLLADKIYGDEMEIVGLYDEFLDEDIDILKIKLQNKYLYETRKKATS